MCNIFKAMQFSISASEIMAELWIISASFSHFIDKKFKSERNPELDTIYDQQVKQKYCKYILVDLISAVDSFSNPEVLASIAKFR